MDESVIDQPIAPPEDPPKKHPLAGMTVWPDGRPRSENHKRLGDSWLPGAKKGREWSQTIERREFVEMVFGAPDSQERQVMALAIRTQFLAGTLAPVIAQTLMHWWLGKPKDTIELKEAPPDFAELSDAELAARARMLAQMLQEQQPTIDVEPTTVLTRTEDLTPPRLVKKSTDAA